MCDNPSWSADPESLTPSPLCWLRSPHTSTIPPHVLTLPSFYTHTNTTPAHLPHILHIQYMQATHPLSHARTHRLPCCPTGRSDSAGCAAVSLSEAFPPGSGLTFKAAAKRYKEPHANGVGELQRSPACTPVDVTPHSLCLL